MKLTFEGTPFRSSGYSQLKQNPYLIQLKYTISSAGASQGTTSEA